LNYFHANGRGLSARWPWLVCFLNSTVVDQYFGASAATLSERHRPAHASYPDRETLQAMCREMKTLDLSQDEIDGSSRSTSCLPISQPQGSHAKRRLAEAIDVLTALEFSPKQRNETALHLARPAGSPADSLGGGTSSLCGITRSSNSSPAPTVSLRAEHPRDIRDDAVKFFVEAGLLLRNPDDSGRPTNSGRTVYQIEPSRWLCSARWAPRMDAVLQRYLISRESLSTRLPASVTSPACRSLCPTAHRLHSRRRAESAHQAIIEQFCRGSLPGVVSTLATRKIVRPSGSMPCALGVTLDSAAKIPDVIVHQTAKNWLLLIEA